MRPASCCLNDLSSEDSALLESCLERFETAWQRGERPALDDFLAGDDGPHRRVQLLELVHTDLEYRLKAGEPARIEDYLHRYPELYGDRDAVLDLLTVEFDLRCRCPQPCIEEYQRRFPEFGDELAAVVPSAAPQTPPGKEERRLGRYVLLEEIGRGSFGTIHKAFDSELRRTVALKVPHRGVSTDARFLREARSAAALRHPGIVAVYDAGQAESVWYLVSEFVDGQTLAQQLKSGRPSFRQSAGWIADLADALAHAHRHGVIHRDVKPSNILLDADGQPRLTDFGLAHRDVADGTATEEGQILGTPAYMAPEQARGEVGRIDARTDVYSLGTVLYELLTGELPFHGNNRMLLRQVLEEEPRPPRHVNDEVPRDLETVCLKAMAKEPADRYAGAAEFADDLRRFLQGQPVRARPVGPLGRLLRWSRRRPALAGLSAALLLVAAVGFAGVLWQWRQSEAHLAESDRNRGRALESAHQAHLAINDLIKVGNDPLLERTDLIAVRRKLWQTGVQYYRVFLEQADNDPRFTEPSLRADTASAQGNLASLLQHLGLATEAEDAYAKAESLWQRLLDEEPQSETYQLNLVRIVYAHGHLWRIQGHPAKAAAAFHQVIRELSDHPSRGPLTDGDVALLMSAYTELGDLQEKRDQLREAKHYLEQARIIGEDYLKERSDSVTYRHQLLGVYNTLVLVEQQMGHPDLALQAHRRGAELGQRLLELAPHVPSYGFQLAGHHFALGSLHGAAGRNEPALRAYQQTERWLAPVLQQDSAHFDARYLLALCRYSCCMRLYDLGRHKEAVETCRQAHRLTEQLVRDQPSNPDIQDFLAKVCFWLAKVNGKTGQKEEAMTALRQGAEVTGRLARQAPDEPRWRFRQGTLLHCVADMLQDMKRITEAVDYFRRAAALRESACRDAPNSLTYHADTGGTWHRLGELEERLGHAEEALTAYQHELQHLRAATDERHRIEYQPCLRRFLGDNIRMLKKLGREKEAEAMTTELNAIPVSPPAAGKKRK